MQGLRQPACCSPHLLILAGSYLISLPAHLPAGPPAPCSELCSFLDIDGVRGDITINKAVRALVAYEGRKEAGLEDLERIAPMVLNHRCGGGGGGG
jgi:hypothetical protein